MDDRSKGHQRALRDYPISLRQSARAVFGPVYDQAEKRTLETTAPGRKG